MWLQVVALMTQALDTAVRKSVPASRTGKRRRWFDSITRDLWLNLGQANRDRRSSPTTANLDRHAEARRTYHAGMHRAGETRWQVFVNDLQADRNPESSFWKKTNSVMRTKSFFPTLRSDDREAITATDKAEMLNRFFVSAETIPHESIEGYWREHKINEQLDTDYNVPFDLQELALALEHMKKKAGKAPGDDKFTVELFCGLPHEWHEILLEVCNKSYHDGKLPAVWKCAAVKPLPKKHPPTDKCKDYRPVSLLPVMAKIMERMVLARLMKVIELSPQAESKLKEAEDALSGLHEDQYGFRETRGTTDAVVRLLDVAEEAATNRAGFIFVATDIQRAYDSCSRKAILRELHLRGIRGRLLIWLADFLTDRSQFVIVDGYKSRVLPVMNGTPQGSCLSPILYVLLVDVVLRALEAKHSAVFRNSFADDLGVGIRVFRHHLQYIQDGCRAINAALQTVEESLKTVGSKLGVAKCQAILFHPEARASRKSWAAAVQEIVILVGGHQLEVVDVLRYLGVWIDGMLTFQHHIQVLKQGACNVLNRLTRLRRQSYGLSPLQFVTLYKVIIRPKLEVGVAAWFRPDSDKNGLVKKLSKVQAKALRIAVRMRNRTPSGLVEADLRIPPLHHRFRKLQARYYARTRTNELAPNMRDLVNSDSRLAKRLQRALTRSGRRVPEHLQVEQQQIRYHSRIPIPEPPAVALYSGPKDSDNLQDWVSNMNDEWAQDKKQYLDLRVYVDGSAVGNPGACGVGVVLETVSLPHIEYPLVEVAEPFSTFSNNDEAELYAIGRGAEAVLEQLEECKLPPPGLVRAALFTDSTTAVDWITAKSLRSTAPWPVIKYVREMLTVLMQKSRVVLCWIRGHKDVAHHNAADQLAKSAARDATDVQCDMKRFKVSLSALYTKIEADVYSEWNQEYAQYEPVDQDTDARYPKCHQVIPSKAMVKLQWEGDFKTVVLRALVRLGCYGRVFWRRTGQAESDICQAESCSEIRVHRFYNDQPETTKHLVMHCSSTNRVELYRYLLSLTDYNPIENMENLTRWMGCDSTLTLSQNSRIIMLLDEYLKRRDAQAGLNPVPNDDVEVYDHSDSSECSQSSSPSTEGPHLSEAPD